MEDTLTADKYESLIDEMVDNVLTEMRERADIPTDNLDEMDADNPGMLQEIEHSVLFTPYKAFNDKSLAAFEDEMTNTFAGSILDHSTVHNPDDHYDTYRWKSSNHFSRVAMNHLYTEVRQNVFSHLRRRFSEQKSSETAA